MAKPINWNKLLMLVAVAVIVLIAAGGGFLILLNLPPNLTTGPYTVVVLLVAGFVTVTLLLYLGSIILRTAGLGSKGEALGMPEGSIRALIAMSLILIFAIIGVTVLYSGFGGETVTSKAITAAEIDRLENVQIVGISLVQPAASPSSERFDVVARAELSQAGHDFGLQLLSTVSTLVVAVAGFYFGSRSVAQATKTSNEAAATALAASRQLAATASITAAQGASVPAIVDAAAPASDDPLADDDIIGTIEDDEGVVDGEDATTDAADTDAETEASNTDAETEASNTDAETEASDAAAEAEAIAAENKASDDAAIEPEGDLEPSGETDTPEGGPKPAP